jgi:ArsR family transcriptional regulator, arsenate/arsenite/antimonite-responsive transcriptional repressor
MFLTETEQPPYPQFMPFWQLLAESLDLFQSFVYRRNTMNIISSYDQTEETLARLAKALSHPARVRILRHLLEAETCVSGEFGPLIGLAQSTTSQHLAQLRESGLLRSRSDGRKVCWCVAAEAMEQLRSLVHGLSPANPECC